MSTPKRILLYLQAAAYAFAGFNHLWNPSFYVAIMPPELPSPEWLNLISGLAEIVLAVFLLDKRTRWIAAWGIIALLIAIFPANLYVAEVNLGADGPGSGNAAANWIRLPFQLVFLAWAWWYTGAEED